MTRNTIAAMILAGGTGVIGLAWTNQPETREGTQNVAAARNTATTPAPRTDEGWVRRNDALNARAKQAAQKGDIRVLFLGDSITQGWESDGKEAWEKHWAPLGAANFGISGDRTQHVLWRLANGNLAGLAAPASGAAPKVVVLMIGTNNSNGEDNTAEEIGAGIGAIVSSLREKLPATRVLVLGIFPRGEKPDSQRQKITKVNAIAARLADGKFVHYLDIGPDFLSADGTISREVMPDFLHLSRKGYDIWSNSIQARVNDLMTAGE